MCISSARWVLLDLAAGPKQIKHRSGSTDQQCGTPGQHRGLLLEFTGQCCCIYYTCRHIRPLPSDMLNSRNSKPRYNRRKPAKGTAYIPLGRICHVAQTYNYNTLGKMGKCHVSTCRILGQVAVQKCQVSPVHTWQRMGDIRKRMQKPDTSSG